MASAVRSPAILSGLVLLLAGCAFAATCSSTFVALPSAMHEGFAKAGSIRTSTLHIMGLSMSAIRVSNLEILSARSTVILTAVECLKPGQKACLADSNGNIGSGNKGKNNFGTNNVGNDNIGNSNLGTANWGNNNDGKGNRCFNKTGDRKFPTTFITTSTQPPLSAFVTTSTQPPLSAFVTTSTQPPLSAFVTTSTQPPLSASATTSTQPPFSTAFTTFTQPALPIASTTSTHKPSSTTGAYDGHNPVWRSRRRKGIPHLQCSDIRADFVPFASYIEVVAVKYGVASSNYLTLHW
ncbi:hypothetical protein ACKKBF_B33985 [Auxenochlorella protothecoides x Auxenochlorella symbiontica]